MKLALAATALVLALPAAAPGQPAANCAKTSVAKTPLTELGKGRYRGYRGGLYANGKNVPPTAYLKLGLARAKSIKPIEGKIVLLAVGMSNTTQEFSAFRRIADADARKNPSVTLVDGAKGGQDAELGRDPSARLWAVVDTRLGLAGATAEQVQVVWLKEAILGETRPFPADAKRLKNDLAAMVGILRDKFPNLKLVYVSSRTYGGYASKPINPEPFAYESGFAVKWLVLDRIAGKLAGPWLAWGPYLWTNGEKGRKDGLVWRCGDTSAFDGTHPTASGQQKVAQLLLKFFTTNATARPWFVSRAG